MSEEREPVRLRDDPAQDAGLREMLDAARGEIAPDAMLDRVLGKIVAGGGGGGSSGGSAATAKIAAAIGATAIGVAVIALVATQTTPTAHEVTPTATVDAFVLTDDAYVAPDGGPPDAGTDALVVVARVVPRPPPPPPPTTVVESDGAMLLRATREHDPSAQLALALEHRALFPTSASAEDREALIVIDLARLHRTTEANEAASTFRSRWPRSAHRTRIDTELARSNP